MNEFEKFLIPAKKENLRFVLSKEHTDENGAPLVWEMKQLSAREGLEIERQYCSKGDTEVMVAMAAASLAIPDLSDAKLLSELSEKCGAAVLSPSQALKAMLTMAELIKLIKIYISFNGLDESVQNLVAQAKN